ncbi:hypothetical protein EVAR_53834_1 [Eumeta japonica]|uniref:Uncharacterized protein n=1 Tax=Eumeta variegata TaxID=151549 RepID=A0A4C1ZGE2_EUMVA|nr:hypothetical protein EVAR_53834_1 [Eumeta japonica]
MEVDQMKEQKKRASDTCMSEKSESESESDLALFSDESNESNDEGFTQVQSRKARKPFIQARIYPFIGEGTNGFKVATDETDVITMPIPKKTQKSPPLCIHDKDRWLEIRKQCVSKNIVISNARNAAKGLKVQLAAIPDFRNLCALLATLKVAYHTYFLMKEREFHVVLRGLPKELPIEETAPHRAPARAATDNLSYMKATAESRKDPPTNNAPITSSTEDIKAPMSMIFIIDIGALK